jgi:hypothetical protein
MADDDYYGPARTADLLHENAGQSHEGSDYGATEVRGVRCNRVDNTNNISPGFAVTQVNAGRFLGVGNAGFNGGNAGRSMSYDKSRDISALNVPAGYALTPVNAGQFFGVGNAHWNGGNAGHSPSYDKSRDQPGQFIYSGGSFGNAGRSSSLVENNSDSGYLLLVPHDSRANVGFSPASDASADNAGRFQVALDGNSVKNAGRFLLSYQTGLESTVNAGHPLGYHGAGDNSSFPFNRDPTGNIDRSHISDARNAGYSFASAESRGNAGRSHGSNGSRDNTGFSFNRNNIGRSLTDSTGNTALSLSSEEGQRHTRPYLRNSE